MKYIREKISKTRSKKIFYSSVLVWAFLGTINILLNINEVMVLMEGSYTSLAFGLIGNYISALFSMYHMVIVTSLVTYFVAAAMNIGFDIKMFGRISAKALAFAPLLGLSDMIGLVFWGEKLTNFGLLGLLSYIPFYFTTAYLHYAVLPDYISTSKKQRVILMIAATAAAMYASHPSMI